MGLIHSYSKPTADSATGNNTNPAFVTIVGSPTAWEAVDDDFRPKTVRGSGAGSGFFDDPFDDSNYFSIASVFAFPEFDFTPDRPLYFNGDDIALQINVRASTASAITTSHIVDVYRTTPGPIRTSIGRFTISGSGTFANYTVASVTDPSTSLPWAAGALDSTPTFGVRLITPPTTIRVSRIYLSTGTFVGPTVGRDYRQSNWRFCDVCGFKTPYERTQRPTPPHPQSGLVVCTRCYDQPDHDTNKIMSNNRPKDVQDALY